MSNNIDFLSDKNNSKKDKDRNKQDFVENISFHIPKEEEKKKDGFISKMRGSFYKFLSTKKEKAVKEIKKKTKEKADKKINQNANTEKADKQKSSISKSKLERKTSDQSNLDLSLDVNLVPEKDTKINKSLYLKFIVFFLVILISSMWGFVVFSKYQKIKSEVETIEAKIAEIDDEVNTLKKSESVKNKLEFYLRQDAFVDIYSDRVLPTKIFKWLENIVVDGVVFKGFRYNPEDGSMSIKANAESYEKVVWQWYLLRKNDAVNELKVTNITGKETSNPTSEEEDGYPVSIFFDIKLNLDKFKPI